MTWSSVTIPTDGLLRKSGVEDVVSPSGNTSVVVTDTGVNFVVNSVSVGSMTESGGVGKLTWPGIFDPVAYAGTAQTIAQRNALVAVSPLTKAGYLTYVVDTGVSEYQVFDGTSWITVGASGVSAWVASTVYAADKLVRISMLGANVLMRCSTSHTSAATFTAVEAANWTLVCQDAPGAFAVSTVVLANLQVINSGSLYKRTATGTTGAGTFSADAANWTTLIGIMAAVTAFSSWAATTAYVLDQVVRISMLGANVLIRCTTAHTSAATFTVGDAGNWATVSQDIPGTYAATTVVLAGVQMRSGGTMP